MSNSSLETASESEKAPFHTGTPEDGREEERPLLGNAPQQSRCCGSKWGKIFISVCIWIGYLLLSAAYSVIGPFFPQEAAEFDVNSFFVGLISGVSPLIVVFVSPLAGYFMPKIGIKFMLVSGMFLVGGPFVLLGFLVDLSGHWQFILFALALRTVEGFGTALYFTASFTYVTLLHPSSIGMIMGIMELGSGLGYMLGPPLGGLLYSIGGFRMPFLVTGGMALLCVPASMCFLPSYPAQKQVLQVKTIISLMLSLPFFLLALMNIILIAALGFFTPTLAPFLLQEFNLNEIQIGVLFLIIPLFYTCCAFIVGKLTDRLGQLCRYLIISGMLLTGLSYFFIGPAPFIVPNSVLWVSAVAQGVAGVGLAFAIIPIFSDMLHIAREVDQSSTQDHLNGVISGLTSSTLSLGEFLGPIIGGTLTNVMSFQMSSVVFGEFLLAGGVLLLGVTLIDRRLSLSITKNVQQSEA